jgi:hypothetical protein
MKPAIRPDQQGKVLTVLTVGAGPGDILSNLEDSLCVFNQGSHTEYLSAAIAEISEENANH